jgi:hypothetical protein
MRPVTRLNEWCLAARILKLDREVERLRHALTTIKTSGMVGGSILAKRSDEHSCAWCRGMLTPCPVQTAILALEKKSCPS